MWKMVSAILIKKSMLMVGFLTHNDSDILRARTSPYRRIGYQTNILPTMWKERDNDEDDIIGCPPSMPILTKLNPTSPSFSPPTRPPSNPGHSLSGRASAPSSKPI